MIEEERDSFLMSLGIDPSLPLAWQQQALCADHPEIDFHPDERIKAHDPYKDARAICAECPVTAECLEFALENGERHGMWGGLNPEERAAVVERNSSGD